MRTKKRRNLPKRAASLVVYAVVSLLILGYAPGRNITGLFYVLPFSLGPIAAFLLIVHFTNAIPTIREYLSQHTWNRPLFYPLLRNCISLTMLAVFFSLSYVAANNFGGRLIADSCGNQVDDFFAVLYFSMVTGCTVGYGEILPEGSARILAFLQMVGFWTFVLVSWTYFQQFAEELNNLKPPPTGAGSWWGDR